MMYLTLEKAPQMAGLGPWMGVVVGEKHVDSDYPEEKKARKHPHGRSRRKTTPGQLWRLL